MKTLKVNRKIAKALKKVQRFQTVDRDYSNFYVRKHALRVLRNIYHDINDVMWYFSAKNILGSWFSTPHVQPQYIMTNCTIQL